MELEKIVVLKLNDKVKSPILPKELEPDVVKRIGSEFKRGTTDCIRGLSTLQERVLLPDLIGIGPESVEFNRKVKDYWADFSVTPTIEGLRLNIATEKTTMKNREGENVEIDSPINLRDYMTFNFAKQSSSVAKTKAEIESGIYPFILIDLSEEERLKKAKFGAKKAALVNFAKLTSEKTPEERLDWVIRSLKGIDEHFNFSLPREDKEMWLDSKKDENPLKFNGVVEDKDLETKALLYLAIEKREITVEGNYYFLGEENIGTEKAVVDYLKSAVNSQKVLALKARLDNIEAIQK